MNSWLPHLLTPRRINAGLHSIMVRNIEVIMITKLAFVLLSVAVLSGCESTNTKPVATKPVPANSEDQRIAIAAIASDLKDPGSMQTRNLKAYQTQDGERLICGEYNARNSFGGYTGFSPFYIRTRGGAIVTYSAYNSNDTFLNATVTASCNEAASGVIKVDPNI